MENKDFAKYLRELRGNRTLNYVESETGVSKSFISRIENNARRASPDVLRKLAECYDVSYDELMVKAGYLEEDSPRRILNERICRLKQDELELVNEYIDKIISGEIK